MYLLDTDVLIWILRGNKEIIQKISGYKDNFPIGISVITIAEVYKNIFSSELSRAEDFLNEHIQFDVNQKIAKTAGFYWQEYSKKIKNLSLADCLIAATANYHSAKLVTLNSKHFPMKDITVINPANPL